MKTPIIVAVLSLAVASLYAADPKTEVTDAAKKLADQPSYAWTTTVVVPESSQFRPGPTEGKTQKDGLTHIQMSFRDNKMDLVLKGQKAVSKNQEGEWRTTAELEEAGGASSWPAMVARNFKLPSVQAAEIAGYIKDMKKEGDAYSGTMTEQGVKALMTFRRGPNAEPPTVANPAGSAKFWIKDGVLTKYEFKVQGKITFNEREFDADRTTTVEIKDLGKAKVDVPAEAKAKLG